MNDLAVAVATKRVNNNYPSDEDRSPRPAKQQCLLPSHDLLPRLRHNKSSGRSNSNSDDDPNNNKADLKEDGIEPRFIKQKRPSLFHNNPIQKKHKHYLQPRPTCQRKPHFKPHRRFLTPHSPSNQSSRVTAASNAKSRLPSSAPFAPHAIDINMPPDYYNLNRSSQAVLPTLTEVTFRPHSPHCYSFMAIIRGSYKDGGLSDSDSKSNSNHGRCSSGDSQRHSNTSKHSR